MIARSLIEASSASSPIRSLVLKSSRDLVCVNLFCERVTLPCVCRLDRVLQSKRLKHIRSLDLSHNKLHILPPSIGDLVDLEDIDISGNDFAELPDPIVRLCRDPNAALRSLRLNRGVKIPADFIAKNLKVVEVDAAQGSE
jgi:hypothetical protein